jgi:DNA-binding beta-propeller fold protein YncE
VLVLIAVVEVGLNPQLLAVSPDGTHVYVACSSANSVKTGERRPNFTNPREQAHA